MRFFSFIIIAILCSIPLVVGFLIIKNIYIGLGKNKLATLSFGLAGWIFFLLILLALGIFSGAIPLSIFGLKDQQVTGIDENGNPDCTPYQSPWGVVCE